MKKITMYLIFIAIAMGCKKEKQPEPQPVQTTQPTEQKWMYRYDYKKQNDPNVYSSTSCLTDSEMLTIKQLYDAFNIQRGNKC